MPDLPRSHLIAYVLAALVILGFGWRQVSHSRAAELPPGEPLAAGASAPEGAPPGTAAGDAGPDGAQSAPDDADLLVVHVAGWVRRPGVYRLAEGLRVDDAVEVAGGARRGADLSQLNLAMKLQDGRQILVARRVAASAPAGAATPAGAAGTAGTAASGVGAGEATGFGAAGAAAVNLNTATLEQLDTLDGVGPVTAEKIVAYREQQGGFGSVEELGEVPGIGPVTLETLRPLVTV